MDSAATEKHGHKKATKKQSLIFGVMELRKFGLNRMVKTSSKRRWLTIRTTAVTKEIKQFQFDKQIFYSRKIFFENIAL